MNKLSIFLALIPFAFILSCEPDQDLITPDLDLIYKVKSTEVLLRDNAWGFNDLTVDVKYEMRAIPLLANVADAQGMVQPGQYNSLEIFGNDNRQKNYNYLFETTKITLDSTGNGMFNEMAHYNVINAHLIKVNPDSIGKITYNYRYLEDEGDFIMTSNQLTNGHISDLVNTMIEDAVLMGKPNDLANAVVDNILGNEQLKDSIQLIVYDLIHGKIAELAENPDKISQAIAKVVYEKLKEVDWETLVYNKVLTVLEELKVDDPEQVAGEIASQIADRIATSISQSEIYDAILPIFQKFEDEALPKLVPAISDAIFNLITKVFTEENIADKINPLWVNFSAVDSSTVNYVADSLGAVLTNHFFNTQTLAASLEPFVATLRSTSTPKIPALAQSIIDDTLIPLVDSLNTMFPAIELEPDWTSIKPILSSALTVLKSSISGLTDAEAAENLAESIIGILGTKIDNAVASAIYYLQAIPADQAAQVIGAWLNNLIIVSEPEIVAFFEGKFNELVDMFNAEDAADEIATAIYQKITEIFSTEEIYNLVFPLVEELNEINLEAAAQKIADWLTDLELIKDNVSEQQILDGLTEIVSQLIGEINVDEVTQKLADALLQSDLVNGIEGEILKQLIEIKSYELLIELDKAINAIDKIEFSITIKQAL